MPVNRSVLRNLALGLGVAGGLGGAGYLGHRAGLRSGATRMANQMNTDTLRIRSEAYAQGANDTMKGVNDSFSAMMSKISSVAFDDEFEKLSAGGGDVIGKITERVSGFAKKVGGSFKNLNQSSDDLSASLLKERKGEGRGKEDMKNFHKNIKNSKLALGTIGAGIIGGGYVYNKATR